MSTTSTLKIITALLCTALLGVSAAKADSLLIHQARLISGDHPSVSALSDVLISDGRIQTIGIGPSHADREIDAHGHYLIPGLLDAHVHLEGVPGYRGSNPHDQSMLQEALNQIPRSYLYFGFTTLLDLAGKGSFIEKWNNQAVAPHAFYCAPLVIPNGYPLAMFADRDQQFQQDFGITMLYDPNQPNVYPADFQPKQHLPSIEVAQAKKDGASCIKVFYETGFGPKKNLPVPSVNLLREVVREAHALSLPVYMHGNSEDSYEMALKAGVDVLAHGLWHESTTSQESNIVQRERALAKELTAAHIAVQPTIQVIYGEQEIFNPDFFTNPYVRQAIPDQLISWYKSEPGQWMKNVLGAEFNFASGDPAAHYQTVMGAYQKPLEIVRRMTNQLHLQGNRLLFGSDTPSGPFYTQFPGMNGRMEMDRWIEAGISPSELFQVMTIGNARALGIDRSVGSIQPGRRADLLLLTENPLESVKAYDTIEWIMINGVVHDRASLAANPGIAKITK